MLRLIADNTVTDFIPEKAIEECSTYCFKATYKDMVNMFFAYRAPDHIMAFNAVENDFLEALANELYVDIDRVLACDLDIVLERTQPPTANSHLPK